MEKFETAVRKKKGEVKMEMEMLNQYMDWIIAGLILLLLFSVWNVSRHLRKLRKLLQSVTDGIQNYLNVVLTEEETQEEAPKPELEPVVEKEQEKKHTEEEEIFHAVLEEYFS